MSDMNDFGSTSPSINPPNPLGASYDILDANEGSSSFTNDPSPSQQNYKVCLICEYKGTEFLCPHCNFPLEDPCLNCHRAKSDCVCNMNKAKTSL
jgi:hypothetical protein